MSRRKKKDDLSDVPPLSQLLREADAWVRHLDAMLPGFREERMRRQAADAGPLRRLLDAQSGIVANPRTPAEDRVWVLEKELAIARREAFVRGAEAMREAAARELDRLLTLKKATAIWVGPDEIRAVPMPKDELLEGEP